MVPRATPATGVGPGIPETLLERYEIVDELGQGATATVYLARQRETGRLVALKVLDRRVSLDADEGTRRFELEVVTASAIDHPNVAHTLAIEEVDGRAIAIASEYVRGPTLRQALDETGPFSFDRTVAVLRDVADALAHAHALRIVHRDVKPANIIIEETTGRAVLTDFGIARTLDSHVALTIAGGAVGTPNYMAPEQIDGRPVDQRADVYALGLVGWEMLTATRPWHGETLYAVLHHQQHDSLPDLAQLRPSIPVYLLRALNVALSKDPAARWRDAAAFRDELTPHPLVSVGTPREVTSEEPALSTVVISRPLPPSFAALFPSGASGAAGDATEELDDSHEPQDVQGSGATVTPDAAPPVPPLGEDRNPATAVASLGAAPPVDVVPEPSANADEEGVDGVELADRTAASAGVAGGDVTSPLEPAPWGTEPAPEQRSALDPEPRAHRRPRPPVQLAWLAIAAVLLIAVVIASVRHHSPARAATDPTLRAGVESTKRIAVDPQLDSLLVRATGRASTRESVPAPGAAAVVPAPAVPATPDTSNVSVEVHCRRATSNDQRACLLGRIARSDAGLNAAYVSLVRAMRPRGYRALALLRAEQRRWIDQRDRTCRVQGGSGPYWGVDRAPCFARMAAARAAALRSRIPLVSRSR